MANKKQAHKTKKTAQPASKAKGSTHKPVKKQRGGFLSILLVLIFLHALLATAVAYSTLQEQYRATSWVLPVLALTSLASIVASVAMWFWKKWGIYLYAAICVTQAVVHLVLTGSGLVVFYDMIPFVILGYVITLQSKNNLFE